MRDHRGSTPPIRVVDFVVHVRAACARVMTPESINQLHARMIHQGGRELPAAGMYRARTPECLSVGLAALETRVAAWCAGIPARSCWSAKLANGAMQSETSGPRNSLGPAQHERFCARSGEVSVDRNLCRQLVARVGRPALSAITHQQHILLNNRNMQADPVCNLVAADLVVPEMVKRTKIFLFNVCAFNRSVSDSPPPPVGGRLHHRQSPDLFINAFCNSNADCGRSR